MCVCARVIASELVDFNVVFVVVGVFHLIIQSRLFVVVVVVSVVSGSHNHNNHADADEEVELELELKLDEWG